MELTAGVPSQWLLTSRSGATLTILADGYHEEQGEAHFVVLMAASQEDFAELPVDGEVPDRHGVSVPVIVARVPTSEVADVRTL